VLRQESHSTLLDLSRPASPVIREEKPGWFSYLLLGLLVLIVLAIIIYFIITKFSG